MPSGKFDHFCRCAVFENSNDTALRSTSVNVAKKAFVAATIAGVVSPAITAGAAAVVTAPDVAAAAAAAVVGVDATLDDAGAAVDDAATALVADTAEDEDEDADVVFEDPQPTARVAKIRTGTAVRDRIRKELSTNLRVPSELREHSVNLGDGNPEALKAGVWHNVVDVFDAQPELDGPTIELSPLTAQDREAITAAAADPAIWELHPAKNRYLPEVFHPYFDERLASAMTLVVVIASRVRCSVGRDMRLYRRIRRRSKLAGRSSFVRVGVVPRTRN